MRHAGNSLSLLALALYPYPDESFREHTARSKEVVILFKRVKRLLKALGQAGYLSLLLVAKVKEVEVKRTPALCMRIYPVLYSVKASHKYSCIGIVRVAGSVRIPKLKAL